MALTIKDYIIEASKCEQAGNREGMFSALRDGLRLNISDDVYAASEYAYELYYMLGFYYLDSNINQAYLCFQNALFRCGNETDRKEIQAALDELTMTGQVSVKATAVVIVSYNGQYFLQKCIESVRATLPERTYKIIVVDNASTDGVVDYLKAQNDVELISNNVNAGFSVACNQAVQAAERIENEGNESDFDIFLLNNDTRLAYDSLFWLKMGLYRNDKVGASGAISNYAGNDQQVDIEFELPNDYLSYGRTNNIPLTEFDAYEDRVRLSGFAILIRAGLWQQVGGMDEDFAPGYFEDDDLSMKISKAGFSLSVCKNSFIYHAGSQSFAKREDVENLLLDHHKLFIQKYGFDILSFSKPDKMIADRIPYKCEDEFNILLLGSGLGADAKYISSRFPKANIVCIELDEKLRDISGSTSMVFDSVGSLKEQLTNPVFNVLIITERAQNMFAKEDVTGIGQLCLGDCAVIRQSELKPMIDFNKIKLIIWDMDNTFWNGTVSEGEVEILQDRINLIRDLADRGIVCSTSSKNDEADVYTKLNQIDLNEFFVFNDINWNDKGAQVKQKLDDMHLRGENTLFIDDEPRNLNEVKYYCKDIMVSDPGIIDDLQKWIQRIPKTDIEHKRLTSYQNMQKRRAELNSYSDKEQFLRDSNIEIQIVCGSETVSELDRIAELIARSNQLNYTKIRDDKDVLGNYIYDESIKKGYIRVKDKYGDYGIAGFYCYEPNGTSIRHFLFSCRIMGLGVVEYIYELLGYPEINVIEPVAMQLNKDAHVDWILINENGNDDSYIKVQNASLCAAEDRIENTGKTKSNRIRILLKGPCDMSAIESYLIGGDITTEFNFVNNQGFITTGQNHTMHIWEYAHMTNEERSMILDEVPFIINEDFETDLFTHEYDVIALSLLPDCHGGLYRNKTTGAYITFGSVNFDLTDLKLEQGYIDGSIVNHFYPFTHDIIEKFRDNWEFVGTTSEADIIRNLEYIVQNVVGNPEIILFLGSEIECEKENAEFANHAKRHAQVNLVIRNWAKDKPRIHLIEVSNYIHSQDDYEDCINHYARNVYYDMATDVVRVINEKVEEIKSNKLIEA